MFSLKLGNKLSEWIPFLFAAAHAGDLETNKFFMIKYEIELEAKNGIRILKLL